MEEIAVEFSREAPVAVEIGRLSRRRLGRAAWLLGSLLVCASAAAQLPLEYGDEIVVTVAVLNVRESPSVSADRVAQVTYGMRGWIQDGSPHWADGYWWWHARFPADAEIQGWVAEGDASLAYVGAASDRSVAESIDPFGNVGVWTDADFEAALELGLVIQCPGPDRIFGADTFFGAPFPAESCAGLQGIAFHRFDAPDLWDLEDPAIGLLGLHAVDGVRVYFTNWSISALRGTGSFSNVNVYVQRPGQVPYLAYTIATQGESYEPGRPDEIMARVKLHLPGEPNCCPSFFVDQVFRADARGLHLVERRTVLNEYGEIAREMALAARSAPSGADPATISSILTEVAAIALDTRLSPSDQQERFRRAQDRWDAELVAVAIRIMPVYDPASGRWRSFDGWARDMAADTSVEAPFGADPVGSTVRMLFDPSFETIGNELGLPDLLGW